MKERSLSSEYNAESASLQSLPRSLINKRTSLDDDDSHSEGEGSRSTSITDKGGPLHSHDKMPLPICFQNPRHNVNLITGKGDVLPDEEDEIDAVEGEAEGGTKKWRMKERVRHVPFIIFVATYDIYILK